MGKVLPAAWQLVLSSTAAGTGRRRRPRGGAAHARQRPAAEAGRFLAGDRPGAGLHADRRLPARARPARRGAGRRDDAPPTGARRSTIAATPTSISASTRRRPTISTPRWPAARRPKARLGPLLWRYAAQVRARRDARGALAKDIGNENLDEWPGADRQVPAGQAAGRRARGRGRNRRRRQAQPTASARPPSSSASTPSAAATSSAPASSSSSPRRAARPCPSSTGPRRAS